MTVLEACVEVLKTTSSPMSSQEILAKILARQLYVFKARDPLKVIGGAIRDNLKKGRPPLVKEVTRGRFTLG